MELSNGSVRNGNQAGGTKTRQFKVKVAFLRHAGYNAAIMKIHDLMTSSPRYVGPENTLVEAAGVMRLFNVGAVAVCDDDRLIGMLTEHDIIVRGVAEGCDLNQLTVKDTLAERETVVSLYEDDDIETAASTMVREHVQRLPVLDHERHLVGMISRDEVF
jgi:CBS domain-containing protein